MGNFMLTIGLIFNILAIIFDSFCVAVMYEPSGTFMGECYVDDGSHDTYECDFKTVLQDAGYTKAVAVIILVIQLIVFFINLMGYVGLHKCNPCLLFVLVLVGVGGIIANLVNFIMTEKYEYIAALIIPLVVVSFYVWIWNTARDHKKKERRGGNRYEQEPLY